MNYTLIVEYTDGLVWQCIGLTYDEAWALAQKGGNIANYNTHHVVGAMIIDESGEISILDLVETVDVYGEAL